MTFPIHIGYKTTIYTEIHKIMSYNIRTQHLTLDLCMQNNELKDDSMIKFTNITQFNYIACSIGKSK